MLTFERLARAAKASISTQVIITTIIWGTRRNNFAIISASVHVYGFVFV